MRRRRARGVRRLLVIVWLVLAGPVAGVAGAALAAAPARAADFSGVPAGPDGPSAGDVLKGLRLLNDLLRRLSTVLAIIDMVPCDSTAGPAAVKPGWPHAQPWDEPALDLAR